MTEMTKLTPKDYATDQEVRWCPGCGDYAILKAVRRPWPISARSRQDRVRLRHRLRRRFPYYVETYGFHTIHGRAPAVATG